MNFINCLSKEATKQTTENGAIGYSTSGKALVDLNFKIPTYRKHKDILNEDLNKVLLDKEPYILKYLFYLRDIRGGLGERDSFRLSLLRTMISLKFSNEQAYSTIKQIPEYGRWDDLLTFIGTKYEAEALRVIKDQFYLDEKNMLNNLPISLLAKWLPSDNASSKLSRYRARVIAKALGISIKGYRKRLTVQRKYLDVTEVKTCSNRWSEIDYNKVSSNANLRYKGAFLKHDYERRAEYLRALERGDEDVVMHSATNFPHDIVSKYFTKKEGRTYFKDYDATLEQSWKALPDLPGLNNTLVIRDGSGSMKSHITESTTALDVADAITLYCSARCSSDYKDKFITFSSRPKFVDVSNKNTLHDKIEYLRKYDDCSNTNLKATFDLILNTAVNNQLKQEDLPSQVMIISDMEFDGAYGDRLDTKTLMETIEAKFTKAGYKLPKLVFWNVDSRTNTFPVREGNNVLLVSGFSVQVINMILSGEASPYKAITSVLDNKRYENIPLIEY